MAVITMKVSEQDKAFFKAMAKFEGVSLSEMIRSKTLSALEDEYDARVADESLEEYKAYLADGGQVLSWKDMIDELGLAE
ncbi:MAG: DUF6290 family protein [Streptococcaceae bacterium]|jgi:hypothetical protein|nr:DUF6290 family protein [Streptococcaceae bacterium]